MPPLLSSPFKTCPFPRVSLMHPSPFRTALGSLFHTPSSLSSSPVLLLKWENDGRTMGELRTKERRKSSRAHIGHQDGKEDMTVIISLSILHVSVLPLNPNRSLGFMSEWYLFREDCRRNQRRRSGLHRDGFVGKIPKEMPLWHEKEILSDN